MAEPAGRIGALEREGPCPFCGRTVRMYEVVGESKTSFLDHEHPWCAEYAAFTAEHGLGAEPNPGNEDGDSEN